MTKHRIQTNDTLVAEGTRGLSSADALPKTRETENQAIRHLVGLDKNPKTKSTSEEESEMNNPNFLERG